VHAPKAAPGLLVAAGLIGIWVFIADGPLAPIRVIGLGVHRRGLLAVAVAVAVVPFATGQAHSLEVLLPCLGAAVVLFRLGLVRLPSAPPERAPSPPVSDTRSSPIPTSPSAPSGMTSLVPAKTAPVSPPEPSKDPAPGVVHVAGRLAGRAGSMAAHHADVAVPRGARAAGRLVGRFRARDRS